MCRPGACAGPGHVPARGMCRPAACAGPEQAAVRSHCHPPITPASTRRSGLGHVSLDRGLGDGQRRCYLRVGQAGGQQPENLDLPRGQLSEGLRRGGRVTGCGSALSGTRSCRSGRASAARTATSRVCSAGPARSSVHLGIAPSQANGKPGPLRAPFRHLTCLARAAGPGSGTGRRRSSSGCQGCGPRLSGRGPRLEASADSGGGLAILA
jgi:hypothetical protein